MTKKEKTIAIFGLFGVIACAGITFSIITTNSFTPSKASDENAIIFNHEKNVITPRSIVTSEKGSEFVFALDGVVSSSTCWQKVNADGFFLTQNGILPDENAIHDMKTISFNFEKDDLPFTLYFSRDGSYEDGKCWSKNYVTKKGGQTIEFEGHPRYFKFVAGESEINIVDMKITYGCNAQADIDWYDSHGINPTISGNTLIYGLYPQTHVNDTDLINALTEKAATLGVSDEEYFWYNDEFYVKDTGNPYTDWYTFSDKKPIEKENTYFFKCEPIKWNIVSIEEGEEETNYIIDSSNILYASDFNYMTSRPNDYSDSKIRKWLTPVNEVSDSGDFYNKAFFLNNSPIQATNFSEIGSDSDKVWTGSKDQYADDWYKSNEARQKKATDFALNNHAGMCTTQDYLRNGYYWTRTPDLEYSFNEWFVFHDGDYDNKTTVASDYLGISPSLALNMLNEIK